MSSLFRHRAMDAETARRLLLAHCAETAAVREVQKSRSVGKTASAEPVKPQIGAELQDRIMHSEVAFWKQEAAPQEGKPQRRNYWMGLDLAKGSES